jgi:DNA repair exonuclease SbcCD ATPase subunit
MVSLGTVLKIIGGFIFGLIMFGIKRSVSKSDDEEQDIEDMEQEFRRRITELESDVESIRGDLESDLQSIRSSMEQQIEQIRENRKDDMEDIREKIDQIRSDLSRLKSIETDISWLKNHLRNGGGGDAE